MQKSAGRVRVLVVDDYDLVRESLVAILETCPNVVVVGSAESGPDAIRKAREHVPDVVVMDVSMPGMDGVQTTRQIRQELPRTRVIGLSMHDMAGTGEAMLAAGAVAYLRKGGSADELLAAVCGRGRTG